MTPPLLVLVSGPPAAGKTAISRRLADELCLPLVAKDAIKETLFDTLGVRDLAWTRDLGRAAIALLWQSVEEFLRAGHSVIAESNFHSATDSERLAALHERHGLRVCQIHCTAPAAVLWARTVERERSGLRHPGHQGISLVRTELESRLAQGVWDPLRIAGPTLTVDTDDWAAIPWGAMRDLIQVAADET